MRQFSTGAKLTFVPFERKKVDGLPPKCDFPALQEPEPVPVAFEDRTKNIPYSHYKLNECAKLIRGKHIIEALKIAANIDKKGGSYVKELLEKLKETGIQKGLNPDLFYVQKAFVGFGTRSKMIDIKARGKTGVIHRPKSSLVVILEERPIKKMIEEVLVGNTPPCIGEVFRRRLFKTNANFDDLRRYSFMTTSRGRYYRRIQFKRLILLTQKNYQKKGMSLHLIFRYSFNSFSNKQISS